MRYLTLLLGFGLTLLCLHACKPGKSLPEQPDIETRNSGGGGGERGSCRESNCRSLDTECTRGSCTPASELCIQVPTNEAQPCARGNPCGPARCEAGSCTVLTPPDCTDLDDSCHIGVCDLSAGCRAAPRAGPGLDCEQAAKVPFDGAPMTAENGCGAPTSLLAACGPASGKAVFFEFDTSHFDRPRPVALLVGAPFAIEAALFRGRCQDLSLIACGLRDSTLEPTRTLELSTSLEPGHYTVVVASTHPREVGPIQLAAIEEKPSCTEIQKGPHCEDAVDLQTSNGVEIRWAHAPCVERVATFDCDGESGRALFYALDLSARTRAVQVDVHAGRTDLTGLYHADAGPPCGTALECDERFSAILDPGRYVVAIDPWGSSTVPLRVDIQDALSGPFNDSCDRATELDPAATLHRLHGNTVYGSHEVDGACAEDEQLPQLFYRLDLRGYENQVNLHVEGLEDPLPYTSLLVIGADNEGTCGSVSACFGDILLAPRLYYLAVQRSPPGRIDLQLELTLQEPPQRADCIGESIVRCAKDSVFACTTQGLDAPQCVAVLEECGLAWPGLADVCFEAPHCCDSNLAVPSGEAASCEGLFLAAGARCPGCNSHHCWFGNR